MTDESNPKFLTDFHFLKVSDGKLVFWDYRNHAQFELEPEYIPRLVEFSRGSNVQPTAMDHEIASAGILEDADAPTRAAARWGWDWLSHIYHYGTCHSQPPRRQTGDGAAEYAKSYVEFCSSIADHEPSPELSGGGAIVSLPEPSVEVFESKSLWNVLRQRRTCRDFDGGAVALSTLSNCLFVAFGEQEWNDPNPPPLAEKYSYRRTSPSAGALQATEAYLWSMRVDGLAPAIYRYRPRSHDLVLVRDALPELSLGNYLCNQLWADDLSFAIVLTGRFDRMWWKYPHSRAYRPLLMEIGHFSQTLNLAITACGFHPWITGYFHDKEIADLLRCEPGVEHPLLLVGGGTGSGSAFDRATRALLTPDQE